MSANAPLDPPPKTRLGLGLVAHDRLKPALAAWAAARHERLSRHRLYATGTTGRILLEAIPGAAITRVESGPLGGDLQIGAAIVEGRIDALIFLVDPLTPQPHDVDVKALIRICTVYGAPLALNLPTADALLAADWFDQPDLLRRAPNPFAEDYKARRLAPHPPASGA